MHTILSDLLYKVNSVHKLILEEIENTDLILYTFIECLSRLTHLQLIECYITEECFDIVIELVKNLEYLSIEGTGVNQKLRRITKLDKLKHLNLSGYNYKFDSNDLGNLAYNCKNLESLKIDWVSNDGIKWVFFINNY